MSRAHVMLAALVGVAVFALAWAFGPAVLDAMREPEAGYVTRKDYNPAWTQMTMQCAGYNSNGTCRSYIMVPIYHPESWRMKLREPDGEKSGWRTVSEAEYERYELGAWYP